jgi:hemolysin activation/secretion protein
VIPIRVYPKIFTDLGYVVNKYPGNSFLNDRGLIGYGVGVDVVSAYDFKFRLEYSFNHLGQKDVFLHLNSE